MSSIVDKRGIFAEAMVKVRVQGEVTSHRRRRAMVPSTRWINALRKALIGYYPQVANFHLSDYKVRILDSDHGTEAITRVLIDTRNTTITLEHCRRKHEYHRSKLARAGRFGGIWFDGGALKHTRHCEEAFSPTKQSRTNAWRLLRTQSCARNDG